MTPSAPPPQKTAAPPPPVSAHTPRYAGKRLVSRVLGPRPPRSTHPQSLLSGPAGGHRTQRAPHGLSRARGRPHALGRPGRPARVAVPEPSRWGVLVRKVERGSNSGQVAVHWHDHATCTVVSRGKAIPTSGFYYCSCAPYGNQHPHKPAPLLSLSLFLSLSLSSLSFLSLSLSLSLCCVLRHHCDAAVMVRCDVLSSSLWSPCVSPLILQSSSLFLELSLCSSLSLSFSLSFSLSLSLCVACRVTTVMPL